MFRAGPESPWAIRFPISRPLWRLVASLVVLGLALGLGWAGLRPYLTGLAAQKVASGALLPVDADDPRLNAQLAARYHLGFAEYNPQQAWVHYGAALHRMPLSPRLWLGLAWLYDGASKREGARRALEMALRVAGPSPAIRWEAASLHLGWGELEQALAHLRFVYEVDPARRRDVLILGRLLLPPDQIAGRLIPEHPEALQAYLDLVLSQGNPAEARVVWDRLLAMGKTGFALSRRYTQVLIREEVFNEAMDIWGRLYGGGEGLVWNGGFERKLVGWGFGWRVRNGSGVKVAIDPAVAYASGRSLRVRFTGMPGLGNVVPAEQLILVTPGETYRLSAKGKASELFTRSGLVLEVLDGAGRQALTSIQVPRGTRDWVSLEVEFQIPPGVRAVQLRLRRRPSDVWELPIYGTAWVDEVSLRPVGMTDG